MKLFLTDPVGNGTAKDKRLDPTPVDQLVAVSCSVFRINLNCALQNFFPADQSASTKIKVFTIIIKSGSPGEISRQVFFNL